LLAGASCFGFAVFFVTAAGCSLVIAGRRLSLSKQQALFNPKRFILIQKCHPYTGRLNSETTWHAAQQPIGCMITTTLLQVLYIRQICQTTQMCQQGGSTLALQN
jgi:hypothetical protein